MNPAPKNAEFLRKAIAFLSKASCLEAVDFYRTMYQMPGCDDWLLAELGKEDLYFLLTHLLRRPDVGHPWVYERCREIEAEPDEHLDLWAREHYKSTVITFGLTIQDVLRDPEVTCGIFSNNRPLAKGFLRQIKLEFEQNDTLKALYPSTLWQKPQVESPKWSEDEGIIVKRRSNPKEATIEAWGLIDGMPTGKHFKRLIYDDVVTETTVTPVLIEKTNTAMSLSYSLGAEGGTRRWVGTRYHFNDSYRMLISRGTATVRKYDGTEDNSGDITRPVLLSKEAMAKKRRDMGPYIFACQILQNPRADETQGFRREWLQYWTPDKGAGLNIYLLRDPASKKKEHSDYTSDWVVGLGPDENFYVLALYRYRLNLTERTRTLFELHRKWKPIEVRYEEYGLQADIEHIEEEMDRRKYRFKIHAVSGRVGKEDRIKRLVPIFENHRMILPRSFHYTGDDHETKDMVQEFIENEYMAFPVPVHDDMLDGLARITETEGHLKGSKVKLELQWPSVKKAIPIVEDDFRPHDAGMGY